MSAICKLPGASLGVEFFSGGIDVNMRFADGDIRKVEPRFSPENLPYHLALAEFLKSWIVRKQVTLAQVALPWQMAQKS